MAREVAGLPLADKHDLRHKKQRPPFMFQQRL